MEFNFYRLFKLMFIASVIVLFQVNAHAGVLDLYFQKNLDKFNTDDNITSHEALNTLTQSCNLSLHSQQQDDIKEYYFPQLIDHHNPKIGTFLQRFYIDETFSTSNHAPIFLYICGEGECIKENLKGAIRKLAEKYHAKLIAVEHRYYGNSLVTPTFSTQDLRYLTTEEALLDLAKIQTDLSRTNHWLGKWIAFGGSYAGSLAAYYRMKFPNQVAGALASSAPVLAKENVSEFDAHITKMVGERCAKHINAVVLEVESALNNKDRMQEIKKMFNASDIEDNLDFLGLITEISAGAVQFGLKGKFCAVLSLSAMLGSPLKGYAKFSRMAFDFFGVKPSMLTPQGAISEHPNDYTNKTVGTRQWFYQSCTEYGYWQPANQDKAKSTRSAYLDLSYYQNICHRLFKIDKSVNTNLHNSDYYQPLLNGSVSRIFFTNGSVDPWSLLSLTALNGNTTNTKLSYVMINDGSHCSDLKEPSFFDSRALKDARSQLDSLVKTWLQE